MKILVLAMVFKMICVLVSLYYNFICLNEGGLKYPLLVRGYVGERYYMLNLFDLTINPIYSKGIGLEYTGCERRRN